MARVLLVDDDRDQMEIRRLILEKAGHKVTCACTASAALEAVASRGPQVVVMDLRMPRPEDGRRLIRGLRTADGRLRIIVVAGWPADLAGAPESQLIDQSLQKPVRSQHLLELIDRVA